MFIKIGIKKYEEPECYGTRLNKSKYSNKEIDGQSEKLYLGHNERSECGVRLRRTS